MAGCTSIVSPLDKYTSGTPITPSGMPITPVEVTPPAVPAVLPVVVVKATVNPLNAAEDVVVYDNIIVTFSQAMNPKTINPGTFKVKNAYDQSIKGIITSDATYKIWTFSPEGILEYNTVYTVTITRRAKDLSGNALPIKFVSTFTTEGVRRYGGGGGGGGGGGSASAGDTTAPTVSSTNPVNMSTNVDVNTNVTAVFSEAMLSSSISKLTFVLENGTAPVSGVVSYSGLNATFNPTLDLENDTDYTATITTLAKDLASNPIAVNYTWNFTTGSDIIAPTVASTIPINGSVNVDVDTNVTAVFSETMLSSTISNTTFVLENGADQIAGIVYYSGWTAIFDPTSDLTADTNYSATITNETTDPTGNPIAANYTWNFTTRASTDPIGPLTVGLLTAGDFVILSKTGITNVPTSAITGNIGTSPITGAAITGLDCAEVTGTIYTVDAAGPACRVENATLLTAAVSAMEAAYTDAAGRALPNATELYAGDLSGRIITGGLYKWSTGVTVDDSGVILAGGANDTWIFQISGDLTLASGATVTLSGGANASNIFWQVGGLTGATLGTTSTLEGTILSAKQVIMNNDATLNGRALAQTQVTLISNVITRVE